MGLEDSLKEFTKHPIIMPVLFLFFFLYLRDILPVENTEFLQNYVSRFIFIMILSWLMTDSVGLAIGVAFLLTVVFYLIGAYVENFIGYLVPADYTLDTYWVKDAPFQSEDVPYTDEWIWGKPWVTQTCGDLPSGVSCPYGSQVKAKKSELVTNDVTTQQDVDFILGGNSSLSSCGKKVQENFNGNGPAPKAFDLNSLDQAKFNVKEFAKADKSKPSTFALSAEKQINNWRQGACQGGGRAYLKPNTENGCPTGKANSYSDGQMQFINSLM